MYNTFNKQDGQHLLLLWQFSLNILFTFLLGDFLCLPAALLGRSTDTSIFNAFGLRVLRSSGETRTIERGFVALKRISLYMPLACKNYDHGAVSKHEAV